MPDTWGSVDLNVSAYSRPTADFFLREVALVPDPSASTSSPQSILMGSGRMRKRRFVRGTLNSTDYDSIEADKNSYTSRTLTFNDGFSMTALVESLDGERRLGTTLVFYSATFVEAST